MREYGIVTPALPNKTGNKAETKKAASAMNTKAISCKNEYGKPTEMFSHVPKIADLLGEMTDTERGVAIALAEKDPQEGWEGVAQTLGLSVRQLYNYRTKQNVLEASQLIVRESCKSEVPEVLKRLVKEAKSGKNWAIRTFLEWAAELPGTKTPAKAECRQGDLMEQSEKTLAIATRLLSDERAGHALRTVGG